MKKRVYYFVPNDSYGQRGTDIREILLTEEEYAERKAQPWHIRGGAYFEKYIEALYYTQD